MTVLIVYIIIENIKHNEPMAEIVERRTDIVEQIDFLGSEENGSETLYFTLGEVIGSENLFLSVDQVKKTWLGYRWINGGGHTSKDVKPGETMTLQYLGGFVNIDEMLFGMIAQKGTERITIQLGDKLIDGLTYKSTKNDYLYYYVTLETDEVLQIDRILLYDNQGHETSYRVDINDLVNQESDFRMISIDLISQ